MLLWDSAKIHRNEAVRLYLRRCRRLHLHHFPAYALELNPDEHFWTQTKQTLANSTPANIDELQDGVGKRAFPPAALDPAFWSCIDASELPRK